jgi:hypothetical protein
MSPSMTRTYAVMVAGLEGCAGISGLVLGETHFTGPTYAPARHILGFIPGNPS